MRTPRRIEQKIKTTIPLETNNSRETLRALLNELASAKEPEILQLKLTVYGCESWTDKDLLEDFEIESFYPPYATVIRKNDGRRGNVIYTEKPRVYFCFEPDTLYDAS
jgi:hypothetical protein